MPIERSGGGRGTVTSVTAGNPTITVGGTGTDPTVAAAGFSAAFSIVNTAALSTIISVTITGGTLGSTFGLLVTIEGRYLNNTGVGRGLLSQISYGGSNLWGDNPGAAFIASSALQSPLYWQFLLSGRVATNAQNMGGIYSLGPQTNGSIGGSGSLAGVAYWTTSIAGAATVDSTADQTLLVQAQHSFASNSLTLAGTAHIQVIV